MTTLPQHQQATLALNEAVLAPDFDEARFSRQLAALTTSQHEDAENSSFMQDLMSGRLDVTAYARLSGQLVHVYTALEERGRELASDPLAAAVHDPALERTVALEADLLALSGHSWREQHLPLSATRTYMDRIAQLDGVGYLAHHYVRYLGDLSGGFIVARLVSRAYGLVPGEPGLLFHHFPAIAKPKPYKDSYRLRIDEAAQRLTEAGRTAIIAEARAAFAHNTAIFRELASPVGSPPGH
ncbi:heme oxygenase (biliverdin-producing) [Bogoriella caseilytica]|uniref:Heme oxygenase n=1 Tax=Bogoriella caseilytica TaxID=56055 RepID=A0A3N2BAT6_9MICO|nr:biliverdin-producing heme oxygenase [Bogoriella caseilytica]ROR72298.1 heme oxygenase [Bogoriella caseilytica]